MRLGDAARPGSLQLEIVANLFVVMLAGLTIVAVVMGTLAAQTVEREAVERLRLGARHLERLLHGGSGRLSDMAAIARTLDGRTLGGTWSVHLTGGRPLPDLPLHGAAQPDRRDLVERAVREGEIVEGGGLPPRDLVLAVAVVDGRGRSGVLVGVVPEAELRARLGPLLGSGAWVLAIAALVFVLFGSYLLRRRIVLPVQELSSASQRIAAGDLSVRVPPGGADELGELAHSFSEMAASLERQRDALLDAQRSLSRSERLASVGRLAAGVAHEVGNPVAAILGYAEVALRQEGLSERTRDTLVRMRDEALRIRTLVRELLDLARSEELEVAEHDAEALLTRVIERLSPQPLLAGIELRLEVEEGLPPLAVDGRRVEQVLVNLIENAAHAVREKGSPASDATGPAPAEVASGEIAIHVARARLRPHASRLSDAAAGGSWGPVRAERAVAIDVIDNGPGIDPEDVPHVFDPFFTTKDPGLGTGLGLWNAHRIAELLGGALEVESRPGRTRFSLELPVADRQRNDGPARTDHR